MMAKLEHEIAYQDLAALMARHADKMTALELLAVAANLVGKLVAMQDQRKVTPELAMKIVAENLEFGNQQALEQVMQSQGRS